MGENVLIARLSCIVRRRNKKSATNLAVVVPVMPQNADRWRAIAAGRTRDAVVVERVGQRHVRR